MAEKYLNLDGLDEIVTQIKAKLLGKVDVTAGVTNVAYDSSSKKLKQTINGSASDVVTFGDNAFTSTAIPTAASQLSDYSDLAQASDVSAIEAKIPNAASSSNQLADKEFVNSSISTATATFQGTYNLVTDLNIENLSATHSDIGEELEDTIEGADDNDYCFVEIPTAISTPTQLARVEKYKYNNEASIKWEYEYTLNNSSFTAAQWAAINSGATTTNIGQISTNASNITSLNTNKVNKTTTIAGVDLQDNITKTELLTALNVADGAQVNPSFENTATNIKMNGTQSIGSLSTVARADHVHPSDTSKQDTLNGVTDTSTDIIIEKEYGDTTGRFYVGSSYINIQGNDGDGGGSFDITGELLGPGASDISLYAEGVVDNETVSAGLTLEPTGLSYTDANTDGEGFLINGEPAATRTWTNTQLSGKQDALTAGDNITITNNVISAEPGIKEITTQRVNVYELETGVYKLTYAGAKQVYYSTTEKIDLLYLNSSSVPLLIVGIGIPDANALNNYRSCIMLADGFLYTIYVGFGASYEKYSFSTLGKFIQKSDVKNNLTSTDTDKPLSAAQGKALKDEIDTLPDTPITTAEIDALFN